MIFQKKNIQTLNLKIDSIDIEQVTDFNVLGLIIDTNLNWKKHTEKISNGCSNKNSNFKQIETYVTSGYLKHII